MTRRRQLGLAALVVALGASTSIVGGSLRPSDVAAASCGPAPSGRVAVAVVVDNGATPSTRCVTVPDRANGYDALIAAGHTLRIESGFLCAIDGVPATGCGNRADFAGAYWRYFHAAPGGTWDYSRVGGGGYRLPARCAVEGWRWSNSPKTETTPRVAPPSVTCEAPAPPAPTAPQAAPSPTPGRPVAPPAPLPEAQPPATTSVPSGGSGAASPGPGAAPQEQPDPPRGTPEAGTGESDGTVPGPEQEAGSTTSAPVASSSEAAGAAGSDVEAASDAEVLSGALDAGDPAGESGGSPTGALLAVAAMVALVGAAVIRSTRRRGREAAGATAD